MRIVLVGVSHWHTPFYSDPVLGMKDAAIVGVSDPDAERAAPLAAQAHYSIRTDEHYFAARDNATLEIVTNDRQRTTRAMKLTNAFFYTEFTHDTLRRVRDGRPPIADLADNAAAVALIEAAYAMSPLGG